MGSLIGGGIGALGGGASRYLYQSNPDIAKSMDQGLQAARNFFVDTPGTDSPGMVGSFAQGLIDRTNRALNAKPGTPGTP